MSLVRRLCLLVAADDEVAQPHEFSRWAKSGLADLHLCLVKEKQHVNQLRNHQSDFANEGDFRVYIQNVHKFIVTIVVGLLGMPRVKEHVSVALSCLCPEVLLRSRVGRWKCFFVS